MFQTPKKEICIRTAVLQFPYVPVTKDKASSLKVFIANKPAITCCSF